MLAGGTVPFAHSLKLSYGVSFEWIVAILKFDLGHEIPILCPSDYSKFIDNF